MKGVSELVGDEQSIGMKPDQAARKRVAVELIRDHDQPLRWTARRYAICDADAEDAYQRGVEILLSKAPTTDIHHLLPWTRKVIKHEALAIRKQRERTMSRPGASEQEDSDEDWIQLLPSLSDGPDELAIQRERVARSKEALSLLKPAELKALTQLAEGFSYQEIGSMNDWTRTKVNRCLAEGRARFRSVFQESESGGRCAQFESLLSAGCDGELDSAERAELDNHLAACGSCRSTLRTYRAAPRAVAALAPVLPTGRGIFDRAQELLVDWQIRIQGFGKSTDSGLQTVLVSGGTRGAGAAAIAKLVAVCAGTAGTAAVCAATGVLPATDLISEKKDRAQTGPVPALVRETRPDPMKLGNPRVIVPQPIEDSPAQATQEKLQEPPQPTEPAVTPIQAPTPTETEFTPEASGTPVPAAVPPPKPNSSAVPVTNGGGEFAP